MLYAASVSISISISISIGCRYHVSYHSCIPSYSWCFLDMIELTVCLHIWFHDDLIYVLAAHCNQSRRVVLSCRVRILEITI